MNCWVSPVATVAVVGEMENLGLIVIVAVANLVLSALEVALAVTGLGLGTAAGAVYNPSIDIVPTVELPPTTSFTVQVMVVSVAL